MKMRIISGIAVAIMVSAILPAAAIAAPQVSIYIYTDKQNYQAGETIEVSLAGINYGGGTNVDVYVGLLTPGGALYTLAWDGWRQGIGGPWARALYLPRIQIRRKVFFWLPLPCEMPPIDQPGEFFFLAALTRADTADLLAGIAFAAFMVGTPQGSDYYIDAKLGDDANYGSEEAPWRSITHALYSVESCQERPVTIHVAPGSYFWATDEGFPLNMKSWVSLVAEGNGTTIDAEQWGASVISCENVEGVTIRGFTITGGGPDSDGLSGVKFGGGIFCSDSSVLIADNIIMQNSAGWVGCGGGGGGIYSCGGRPVIVSNLILQNAAEPLCGAAGGGILCENSAAIIANNTIIGNTARYGGGIAIFTCSDAGPAQIFNNTLVDNTGYGSGIYGSSVVNAPVVVDCIVWGADDHTIDDDVSASYCCIKGGHPGEGNIDQDPMLVADWHWPGWIGWKRYLDPKSPCIDAGSRSAEEAGLSGMTTQQDGTPDTGRVDMGVHYPVPLDSQMRTSLGFQE